MPFDYFDLVTMLIDLSKARKESCHIEIEAGRRLLERIGRVVRGGLAEKEVESPGGTETVHAAGVVEDGRGMSGHEL